MKHFNIWLKARALAGDILAINYDEAFCQRASNDKLACWDLRNNNLWLETVDPHARVWVDTKKEKRKWVSERTAIGGFGTRQYFYKEN